MIDRDFVKEVLEFLATTDDPRVNATSIRFSSEGTPLLRCVYEDQNGNRCVIGQLFSDRGFNVGDWENTDIASVVAKRGLLKLGLVDQGAVDILYQLQQSADSGDNPAVLKAWGQAARLTLEELA